MDDQQNRLITPDMILAQNPQLPPARPVVDEEHQDYLNSEAYSIIHARAVARGMARFEAQRREPPREHYPLETWEDWEDHDDMLEAFNQIAREQEKDVANGVYCFDESREMEV